MTWTEIDVSASAVSAVDLQVHYHRPEQPPVSALRGIDLSIEHGEFVAVIGASGAGKTTFLRCLTRFVDPSSGELTVDGTDVTRCSRGDLYRLRRRVATIYQHFNLVERATTMQNVLHGRLGHVSFLRGMTGLFPLADRERAWDLLVSLGLADRALQRVDQLSGGERQRVAIARALIQEPSIVLADEPASSLDVSLTRSVIETLHQLQNDLGMTVIVNMHDLELARSCATRVVGLRHGEVIFDGAPAQLDAATLEAIYDRDGAGRQSADTPPEPAEPERIAAAYATA